MFRRFFLLTVVLLPASAVAGEPLHSEIDRLIAAKFDGRTPAAKTDDGAFLRRVWLDFAGHIPSAEETRKFLVDTSDEKRTAMIDRLLAASSYAEQMENQFHIVLLERRGDNPEWRAFLHDCFAKNVPWNEIVKQILAPDDTDEAMRGAAFFYTERLTAYGQNPVDYSGLTRDVGRLFLGVDLQCAECHNHLFIEDYHQQEFQGLFSIYKNLSIRREKFPAVAEKAMTEKLEFVSVFDPTKRATGPRIPFGQEFEIPAPAETDDKQAKNAKKPKDDEGPKFSALKLIAENLPTTDNDLFARSAVNRLWFLLMGRGLVEPLDQFHSANPPSHPELLDLLAREFAAHKFDIKWLLRELALSDTYQRSSLIPVGMETPPSESYLVSLERRMSPEQLLASTLVATGNLERVIGAEAKTDEAANKEEPEALTMKELQDCYLKAFANDPREPEEQFTPSVKAALFVLNDEKALELTRRNPDNLTDRLAVISDKQQRTDELFLSVFTRLPSADERQAVDQFLDAHADNLDVALSDVVWSMISSIEFSINH